MPHGGSRPRWLLLRLAILLVLCGLTTRLVAQSEDYAIDWYSLDCGGGTSADATYSVSGTIGQWDAGEIVGAEFSTSGGFWAAVDVATEPVAVPPLTIARVGNSIVISWPVTATDYYLLANADLFRPNGWFLIDQPTVEFNGLNMVTLPASDRMLYFRLSATPGIPRLTIARSEEGVVLSWPEAANGYFLEQNFAAGQPNGWSLVAAPVVVSNGRNTVTLPAANAFTVFRLTQTPRQPTLTIVFSGNNIILSWPASVSGYFLEQNRDLTKPDAWSLIATPPVVINGMNTVTLPAANAVSFFRLTQTPSQALLTISRSGNNVILSWAASLTGYSLEQNPDVTKPVGWTLVGAPVVVSNGLNTVTLPTTGAMSFFRLTRTPGPPALVIVQSGSNVILSWPAAASGYVLEQNPNLTQPNAWQPVNAPISVANGQNVVALAMSPDRTFFRLRRATSQP